MAERTAEEYRRTAIHEAGHAVAFKRLLPSYDAHEVTIEPDWENNTAGFHRSEEILFYGNEPIGEDELEIFRLHAVYRCAGYAATIVAGYPEDVASATCGSDFDGIEALDARKAEAVVLMREDRNVAAVSRVAQELLKRRTIDAEMVWVLIDVADGDATEEEFEQYLMLRSGN